MEHVRKNEKGGLEVVCENGDVLPAVKQREGGWVPCPYHCTLETHTHGVDDVPLTHRVAHCGEDRRGVSRLGYFLLRPVLVGLLDLPLRWWEDRSTPPRPDTRPRFGGLGGIGGFVGVEGVDLPSGGPLLSVEGV